MAFTVQANSGFVRAGEVGKGELLWLPGDPGVTFTEGNKCGLGSAAGAGGVLIAGTDSLADAVFTVAKTTVCAAATQAFPHPATFDPSNPLSAAANSCLVPVYVDVAAGCQRFIAPIKNFVDDTVVTYTAATRAIGATTGNGADDRPNGALLYVYEGPGTGEINVVEDYDHTGGAVELLLITHRPFATALTTASKYIVLAGEAAADRGVPMFGRVDLADENEADVADGANDGDYVVYLDWAMAKYWLPKGWVPLIRAMQIYS